MFKVDAVDEAQTLAREWSMRWMNGGKGSGGGRGISAFLFGMAHAVDLGGTLAHQRGRFARGPAGDLEALRQDWSRAASAAGVIPRQPINRNRPRGRSPGGGSFLTGVCRQAPMSS